MLSPLISKLSVLKQNASHLLLVAICSDCRLLGIFLQVSEHNLIYQNLSLLLNFFFKLSCCNLLRLSIGDIYLHLVAFFLKFFLLFIKFTADCVDVCQMITLLLGFQLSIPFLSDFGLLFECSCCKSLGLTYLFLSDELWNYVHLWVSQIQGWIVVEFLECPVKMLMIKLGILLVFDFPLLYLTIKCYFESVTLLEALLIFVLFLFRKLGFLYLLCQSLTRCILGQ